MVQGYMVSSQLNEMRIPMSLMRVISHCLMDCLVDGEYVAMSVDRDKPVISYVRPKVEF